jgi:hypothetical protein
MNLRLFEYFDENNNLNVFDILKDLKITCTRLNKDELLKIWEFMVSQSKTCLQGSSFYPFNFFVREIIESYNGEFLNSSALCNSICVNVHLVYKERRGEALENDCKFFSLRSLSKDTTILKLAEIAASTRVLRSSTLNIGADDSVAGPVAKKAKKDFKLNIYSLFFTRHDERAIIYKRNGKKLATKIIDEHDNPDGVFIVLETNFNVWKV